jgi:hypothetical protein
VLGCVRRQPGFGVRSALVGFVLAARSRIAALAQHRARRAAFLDRWYHDDLSAPALEEALTYIRFADKQRANAKGRR